MTYAAARATRLSITADSGAALGAAAVVEVDNNDGRLHYCCEVIGLFGGELWIVFCGREVMVNADS